MDTFLEFLAAFPLTLQASVVMLFRPESNLNIFYLASSALVVAAAWHLSPAVRTRASSFVAYLLPAKVFLHPSALLDYKNYFVFLLVRIFYFTTMTVTGTMVATVFAGYLARIFGEGGLIEASFWTVLGVTTLVEFLMLELGYWVAHHLMHEVPFLWEFHKTHHAAQVMTPATAARVHPVDDMLVANASGVFGGLGLAVCMQLFGRDAHTFTFMEYNAVYYVYLLTFFHLRHSHVWIACTGWLGHIIQSPAHHQIHHSDAPQHAGTNLGYCLVIWDWAFGTLHVPTEEDRRNLSLGIGPEGEEYRTLYDLYILPFVKLLRPLRKPQVQAEENAA